VRGRDVQFPRRDGDDVDVDREQDQGVAREEDSLDVAVLHKVVDDAPLLVETRLVLDVAGKAREIVIPHALLDGFDAAAVAGPVPVRVEGTSPRAGAPRQPRDRGGGPQPPDPTRRSSRRRRLTTAPPKRSGSTRRAPRCASPTSRARPPSPPTRPACPPSGAACRRGACFPARR